MKYHNKTQIKVIADLQNKADSLRKEAVKTLEEADILIVELKKEIGKEFVCEGRFFLIAHGAIGLDVVGNRDWLVEDKVVKVID